MTAIIAGHLELQDEVARVIEELVESGFEKTHITSFYFSPPGQHDTYPIGGDRDQSPGAKETGTGIVGGMSGGGAVGAIVGVAGLPVLGPLAPILGAAVGAHVGALVGSLSQMKEKDEDEIGGENKLHAARKAGMLVAVAVDNTDQQTNAIDILRACGATDLERSTGVIDDSGWRDFDPLVLPIPLNEYPLST